MFAAHRLAIRRALDVGRIDSAQNDAKLGRAGRSLVRQKKQARRALPVLGQLARILKQPDLVPGRKRRVVRETTSGVGLKQFLCVCEIVICFPCRSLCCHAHDPARLGMLVKFAGVATRSRRRSWASVQVRDKGVFEIAKRSEKARIFDQSHACDFRHPPQNAKNPVVRVRVWLGA